MGKTVEELNKDQLAVLFLYEQLVVNKFGKNKREKYIEIAKRMKILENTVKAWIYKYYEKYIEYKQEVVNEKDAKRYRLEGLTEMQARYVRLRVNGYGKEEAKIEAGYSEKTKAANIEAGKKISTYLSELREELIEDTKLGARAMINDLAEIQARARDGVTETEYTDETNPDGRVVRKVARTKKSFAAELTTIKLRKEILGIDYFKEQQLLGKSGSRKENEEEKIYLDD